MKGIIASCIAGGILVGCASAGHPPTEVAVFHGKDNSQIIRVASGSSVVQALGQRDLPLTLPRDSKVCISVVNANAPLFSYSLKSSVDTTPAKPPAFGGILELLQTTFTGTAEVLPTASGPAMAIRRTQNFKLPAHPTGGDSAIAAMYQTYTDSINQLDADISLAKRAILASAQPETIEPTTLVIKSDEQRGIGYAKQVVATLGQEQHAGRFGDPKLDETVKRWKTNAEKKFGDPIPEYASKLIELLDQRAATVLAARNAIQTTYSAVSSTYRECEKVGGGTTTIQLAVQAKDTAAHGHSRDTGTPVSVIAKSVYPRDLLEVLPIGFLAFPSNRTGFGIENGVVAENVKYASDVSFRAGMMLVTSPIRFGEIDEFALGFGLGTGILGDGKPALSDFLGGVLASWRDWLRVGAGYGFSPAPKGLKDGAKVGQALPLTTDKTKLDDFVITDASRSFFLMFTITGLKLSK